MLKSFEIVKRKIESEHGHHSRLCVSIVFNENLRIGNHLNQFRSLTYDVINKAFESEMK